MTDAFYDNSTQVHRCPIPGCHKTYATDTRGQWSHVTSLKYHPNWHPEVRNARDRWTLFEAQYPKATAGGMKAPKSLTTRPVKRVESEEEVRRVLAARTIANAHPSGSMIPPRPSTVPPLPGESAKVTEALREFILTVVAESFKR